MNNVRKILCATLILIMACALYGCSKDVITGEQFKEKIQEQGFVVDSSSDYIMDNATEGFRAIKDGSSMIVTFWTFSSDEEAVAAYDKMYNPSQSEDQELPGTVLEGDNFTKYTVESSDDYSLLSRVGNTLLFAGGDLSEKDTIKEVAESIGY